MLKMEVSFDDQAVDFVRNVVPLILSKINRELSDELASDAANYRGWIDTRPVPDSGATVEPPNGLDMADIDTLAEVTSTSNGIEVAQIAARIQAEDNEGAIALADAVSDELQDDVSVLLLRAEASLNDDDVEGARNALERAMSLADSDDLRDVIQKKINALDEQKKDDEEDTTISGLVMAGTPLLADYSVLEVSFTTQVTRSPQPRKPEVVAPLSKLRKKSSISGRSNGTGEAGKVGAAN
jgi:hypothetical protein